MTFLLVIHLGVKFLGYGVCAVLVGAKSLQSCPIPCDSVDSSPPGSSVHGILKARVLEQVAMHSSRVSFNPGIEPMSLMSPALTGRFFTTNATWEVVLFTYSEAFKISPFFLQKFDHFTFILASYMSAIYSYNLGIWGHTVLSRISRMSNKTYAPPHLKIFGFVKYLFKYFIYSSIVLCILFLAEFVVFII